VLVDVVAVGPVLGGPACTFPSRADEVLWVSITRLYTPTVGCREASIASCAVFCHAIKACTMAAYAGLVHEAAQPTGAHLSAFAGDVDGVGCCGSGRLAPVDVGGGASRCASCRSEELCLPSALPSVRRSPDDSG